MKTVVLLLFFLSFLFLSSAFSQVNDTFCDSTGCVGDVKYSILRPGEFTKRYPGWLLLNGGATQESDSLFKVSKLYKLLGTPSLPDARGVFLRGMNEGRSIDSGDQGGDRQVGSPQTDEYKRHEHPITPVRDVGWSNLGNNSSFRMVGDDGPSWSNHVSTLKAGEGGGGLETRPRNIALYIYIKIN